MEAQTYPHNQSRGPLPLYATYATMQLYATVLVFKMYIGMITYLLVLTSVGTTK